MSKHWLVRRFLPPHEYEEVSSVLLCQQGVKARISARVQRVEEYQKDLRLRYVDKRSSQQGCEAKERYGRPTCEISEDQQRHSFRYCEV